MSLRQITTTQLLLVIVCLSVIAYRTWYARRQRGDRSAQAFSVAVWALAVGTSIQFGAGAVDVATGVPNLGRMLSNCAILTACGAAHVYLVHFWCPTEADHRARREWRRLAVLLPVIVLLFLATPADSASSRADPRHTVAVYSSPYVYLYLTYLGYTLVRGLRELRDCIHLVVDATLRLTLRLGVVGFAAGMAYVAFKFVYLIGHDAGITVPGHEVNTATPMYLTSIGLLALCAVIPPTRAAVTSFREWVRRYRSYQRLYPLWLAFYRAAPTIALDPRTTRLRNLLTVRDLDFLLYRRVIEIRDGQLALRRNVPDVLDTSPDPLARPGADLAAEIRSLEQLAAHLPPLPGSPGPANGLRTARVRG